MRLRTGLAGLVIIARPSQATGVKVRWLSWALPSPGRALPAMSAEPLATASMPEAVLNGCISMRPWPSFSHSLAISVTTPWAVVTSPRQISAGDLLLLLLVALWRAGWVALA